VGYVRYRSIKAQSDSDINLHYPNPCERIWVRKAQSLPTFGIPNYLLRFLLMFLMFDENRQLKKNLAGEGGSPQ